ncbi:MAG: hypothetical protein LQ340_007883 [Diploschistes diacapsis]|nr:MAG: hypothetical protein LQ340_007883 [Diploschistes diacapsis]
MLDIVKTEPTLEDVHEQQARRPSAADALALKRAKKVGNRQVTGASQITLRQSIFPVALVTTLFFCWGFAYGLLDVLNIHFQTVLGVTAAQGGGLSAAYFGAYFISPLTWSGWICRKFGYRWTFITGLCVYGVGALMFWPSGKFRSFGGFCGSMFIVGSGLATLETAADPYISVCGPPRYSEIRLNLSQSFQAIGSVVAPLVATYAIFVNVPDSAGVESLHFCLAVVFFFAPIPEVTDSDMADSNELAASDTGYEDKPMRKQYMLFWGVVAQASYVGAQVAVANYFINYTIHVRPDLTQGQGSIQLAIAQSLFAIGRFSATFLMKFYKPRIILLAYTIGCIVFIICAIAVPGTGGLACLSVVLFFESCLFSTIFTLSLRGLGRHTKRGGSFLVSSIVGGAVWPPMTGAIIDATNAQTAMIMPLIGYLISLTFPIYLNLYKARELDAYREVEVGIKKEQERRASHIDEPIGLSKGATEERIEDRKSGLDSKEIEVA